jgi:uncharacterized protein with predicted RNA binding PUA domain
MTATSSSLKGRVVDTCRNGNEGGHLENPLIKVRSIADYQLGKGVGEKLFPDNVKIEYSPRTGRIRFVMLDGERLATLRPTDGLFSLSIKAAKYIAESLPYAHCFVTVKSEVSEFIAEGGDVFAVHVVRSDDEIRASDEVIVLDEERNVLAVGKAMLSSVEMTAFKSGVAVKVRHGIRKS